MFWTATSVAPLTAYWSVRADVNFAVLLRSFVAHVANEPTIAPTANRNMSARTSTAPASSRPAFACFGPPPPHVADGRGGTPRWPLSAPHVLSCPVGHRWISPAFTS